MIVPNLGTMDVDLRVGKKFFQTFFSLDWVPRRHADLLTRPGEGESLNSYILRPVTASKSRACPKDILLDLAGGCFSQLAYRRR